jgi:transglutaminase-like putative cysteine protease
MTSTRTLRGATPRWSTFTRPFIAAYRQVFGPSDGVMLVVALGMVLIPAFTLQAAEWQVDHGLVLAVCGLSVGFGLLTARSRWDELLSLLVMSLLGVGWVTLLAAQSLPGGTLELLERSITWLNDAFTGGINQDELVFTLLVGVLFWFLGYNTTWHIFHIDRPWRAILPPALIILVNGVFYSGDNTFAPYLLGFLFLGLVALARSAYEQREWEWLSSGVRFQRQSRGQTLWVGIAVAAVLAGISALAPVRPLEEQARSFQEFLQSDPLAELSEVWNRLFAPLSTEGPVSSDYYGGDSLQLSGAVQLGEQVIFSAAAPPAPNNRRYYWRGRVFDTYEYGKWDNGADIRLTTPTAPFIATLEPDNARVPIQVQFTVGARSMRLVHSVPQLLRVDLATRSYIRYITPDAPDSPMNVSAVRPFRVLQRDETYTATGLFSVATADQLRAAGTAYPTWIVQHPQYLRVSPGVISQPVTDLANQIVRDAGAITPYDKAKAIERWLRTTIQYNQNIPSPPAGRDPIEWFLFDLRQGYCNYYATAMVVMLRSQGIPARMAAGFAQGEYDAASGRYVVREADAHTWVEAYFPGYGWIEFEPTTAQSEVQREGDTSPENNPQQPTAAPTQTPTPSPSPTASPTSTPDLNEVLPSPTPQTLLMTQEPTPTPTPTPTATPVILPTQPAPVEQQPQDILSLLLPAAGLVLGLVLLALLLIFLGWLTYWWWEWRGMKGLSPVSRVYTRLERYLGLIGLRFAPTETPEERRRTTMRALPGSERPVTAITRLYTAERYGRKESLMQASPNVEAQAETAWADARKSILGRWLDRFKFWKKRNR